MTDHYAVIGNPIKHSKSPLIHAEFARQTAQDLDYTAIEIPINDLQAGLETLKQRGFMGINVTVPFKEQVWQIVDHRTARAELAGAVNTVIFHEDGSLSGDTTDGVGLCRDLVENHQLSLKDKRILLLGAGGAARGVIEPLLALQPSEIFIANRTASKAGQLAEIFSRNGHVLGGGFAEIAGQYDLVINATAASLQGEVPPLPDSVLATDACCYDMMYGKEDTAFISWAKQHHAGLCVDGLGMLVEQAAEAFYIWRGIRPDTQAVIRLLRA
ncbi:MAG: shikimate dehydrogenase [Methylophaga sp.]|nr:shikimate dehydrogenase [Methylophaga sp.]